MITLLYYSTATNGFSTEKLILLEKQCIEGNKPVGITGILLYNKGSIMQILEGDAVVVEHIFDKIKIDKRHTDVYQLNSYVITERSYSEWSMLFKVISDNNWCKLKDFIKINNIDGGIYPSRTHMNLRLIQLIDSFININTAV